MKKASGNKEYINIINQQNPDMNYITVQEYASRHDLTVMDVLMDIVDGRYDSAMLLINADEECISKHTTLEYLKTSYSEIDGYVPAKKYAEIHNKSYGVLLRDINSGKYKTARKSASHKWYLKQDDFYDDGFGDLVTAKEFAEHHNITYSKLLRNLGEGKYKTALQDETGHWHLSINDKIIPEQYDGIDLKEFIPMKEYAQIHNLSYGALSDDVREGYYDKDIKRARHLIFIRKKAKCITGEKGSKSYILLRKYAEKNDVDYEALRTDVVNGRYKTAKKINNRWYLKPQEKCITYRGMDKYLSARKYAQEHEVSYEKLLDDVKNGVYTTAVQDGAIWLIDKSEPCKTSTTDRRNTPELDGYLSTTEYATKHDVTRIEILTDIKAGIYKSAIQINGRWYIKKDEVCQTYGDDYITLAGYAKLHNVSRSKLLSDIESGLYTTAIMKNDRWLINKNEPFKSVDKRKKENKEKVFISVRQYSINHNLPYNKVLSDVKAGVYTTAYLKGDRWFIDSNERVKTKVRPYRKKLNV